MVWARAAAGIFGSTAGLTVGVAEVDVVEAGDDTVMVEVLGLVAPAQAVSRMDATSGTDRRAIEVFFIVRPISVRLVSSCVATFTVSPTVARTGRRSVLLRLAAERGIPQHDPHLKYAGSGGLRLHRPQAPGVRRRVLACARAWVVVPKSDRQRPNAVGNVDLPQGAVEYQSRKATTMTANKSNGMKKLAVGVALTFVLGGGATAVLLPSFASAAVTTHSSDDPAGHVRHGADDAVAHSTPSTSHSKSTSSVSTSKSGSSDDSATEAKHGSDDAVSEARRGSDDAVAEARRGSDDAVAEARHGSDDTVTEAKHGADDPIGHLRHGADDGVAPARHGADDGVAHARHGADDPSGHL